MLGCADAKSELASLSTAETKRQSTKCRTVVQSCFPLSQSRATRELEDLFQRKFCGRFTSQFAVDTVLDAHNAEWDNLRVLKYLGE